MEGGGRAALLLLSPNLPSPTRSLVDRNGAVWLLEFYNESNTLGSANIVKRCIAVKVCQSRSLNQIELNADDQKTARLRR